jgi:hypothetical protein
MRMTLRRANARAAGEPGGGGSAINSLAVNRRRGESAANQFRSKM